MGYVYSPRELREGRVATAESFGYALETLNSGLIALHGKGYVHGARIHGLDDDEGLVGKDIDVLLVVQRIMPDSPLSVLYRRIWNETRVPVEFIPYTRSNAERGSHYADALFLENVSACKGIVIGSDPVVMLKKSDSIPPEVAIKKHLDNYLRRFGNWNSQIKEKYDEEHCKLLECILRWPMHTAKDMLRLKLGYQPKNGDRPMTKSEACERYVKEFPGMGRETLLPISELRKAYRNMINNNHTNVAEYEQLLADIDSGLEPAYQFITENDELLSEYIKRGESAWKHDIQTL